MKLTIAHSPDSDDAYTGTGNDPAFAAGRISYVMGARGPALSLNTACSSSLVATHLGVRSLRWGGFASEHDAKVAGKLAYVLTGGDISAPAWVDPWYILDLEREAFLSLLGEEKTRERMMHMLQTGKPLRN